MALSPQQFGMFRPIDRDTDAGPVEAAEKTPDKAIDYAYWMNSANPGEHYSVRH